MKDETLDPEESHLWDLIQAKGAELKAKEIELAEKGRLLSDEADRIRRWVEALQAEREDVARAGHKLESLHRGLDAREAELEQGLWDLEAQRRSAEERAAQVEALEGRLFARLAELAMREDQLTTQEEALFREAADLNGLRTRVADLEAQTLKLSGDFAQALEEMSRKGRSLLDREADLIRMDQDLSAREGDVLRQAKRLVSQELESLAARPEALVPVSYATGLVSVAENSKASPLIPTDSSAQTDQTRGPVVGESGNHTVEEVPCPICRALISRDALMCYACGHMMES